MTLTIDHNAEDPERAFGDCDHIPCPDCRISYMSPEGALPHLTFWKCCECNGTIVVTNSPGNAPDVSGYTADDEASEEEGAPEAAGPAGTPPNTSCEREECDSGILDGDARTCRRCNTTATDSVPSPDEGEKQNETEDEPARVEYYGMWDPMDGPVYL